MRVYYILTSIFFLTIIVGCASFKAELYQEGSKNEAIYNAILDFSNTKKLYKRDSIFYVTYTDSLYSMTMIKSGDQIFGEYNEWVPDKLYKELVAVSIGADYNKMLLTSNVKVGKKGIKIPTRYIEKDGKLFYWWDDNYPLTQKALDVFEKYNLLQDDKDGTVLFLDFTTDDAQKGADYYFCRNDLSKYKRIITNVGMGYYKPPNLSCD